MKKIILPGLILLFIGLLTLIHLLGQNSSFPTPLPTSSFAVVELFTSQGCSSCPPADQVLSSISEEAQKKGQAIYTLSFHVDYWNYLGWKDPYSDSRFSQRQRAYAQSLSTGVYTPQMVVNGEIAFVGSRKAEAQKNIQKALSQSPRVDVQVTSVSKNGEYVELTYELGSQKLSWELQVALVEAQVSDAVKRGENRGRTLSHSHVVQEFISQPIESLQGQVRIPLHNLSDESEGSLIIYVQDTQTLEILGATGTKWGGN